MSSRGFANGLAHRATQILVLLLALLSAACQSTGNSGSNATTRAGVGQPDKSGY